MGYAIVHMQKIGKGGVRGIQIHNNREKESRTNPDIDKSRSKDNYDLSELSEKSYLKRINQCVDMFAVNTKTVRKDAVVMCNFIITSDENTMGAMSEEKQREFFQDSVTFFGNRYGVENIVSATVHVDERTPHMHLGIVPISDDQCLSAKKVFTRTELRSLQTDFAKDVGERFGLERGVEGSERTHLSDVRYKIKCEEEKEIELQKEIDKREKEKDSLQNDINASKIDFKEISDVRHLMSQLDGLNAKEKGIFKKDVVLSKDDFEKLKDITKQNEVLSYDNRKKDEALTRFRASNEKLKEEKEEAFRRSYKANRQVDKEKEKNILLNKELDYVAEFFEKNKEQGLGPKYRYFKKLKHMEEERKEDAWGDRERERER